MICPTCGCQDLVKCGNNGYRKKYKCKKCGAGRANGEWFPWAEEKRIFTEAIRHEKQTRAKELKALGWSKKNIAKECGVCYTTMRTWLQKDKSIKQPS